MDASGRIIWSSNDVQTVNVKSTSEYEIPDRTLTANSKELGSCDLYPQSLKHGPNGRFVSLVVMENMSRTRPGMAQ